MQKYVIVTEKFGEKMNASVWLETSRYDRTCLAGMAVGVDACITMIDKILNWQKRN